MKLPVYIVSCLTVYLVSIMVYIGAIKHAERRWSTIEEIYIINNNLIISYSSRNNLYGGL